MTLQKSYAEQAVVYMNQAHSELATGDLRQASEQGWGAAAQMVEALAEEREWIHMDHKSLYNAVSRLSDEFGDRELPVEFSVASSLHINFYEGWFDQKTVALNLYRVDKFVEKLAGRLK